MTAFLRRLRRKPVTHALGITCPDCGWQTMVWVDAAPGGSGWACVVCDLRAENALLRESREQLARQFNRDG